MAEDALAAVALRNNFYRDGQRKMMLILLISMAANFILAIMLYHPLQFFDPLFVYFYIFPDFLYKILILSYFSLKFIHFINSLLMLCPSHQVNHLV